MKPVENKYHIEMPEEIEYLVDRLYDDSTWRDAASQLQAIKPPPVQQLASMLSSQAMKTQVRVASVLRHIGDARAIPALAEVLEDHTVPDVHVLTSAIRALEAIGGLEALDIIEGCLTSYRQDVRLHASEASLKLRKQMAKEIAETERCDRVTVSMATAAPASIPGSLSPRRPYTLHDLTPDLVRELVDQEMELHSPLNRFELVRTVSRHFGREYLIRVRQFVNRYIYPAAARGRFRIQEDFVFLV